MARDDYHRLPKEGGDMKVGTSSPRKGKFWEAKQNRSTVNQESTFVVKGGEIKADEAHKRFTAFLSSYSTPHEEKKVQGLEERVWTVLRETSFKTAALHSLRMVGAAPGAGGHPLYASHEVVAAIILLLRWVKVSLEKGKEMKGLESWGQFLHQTIESNAHPPVHLVLAGVYTVLTESTPSGKLVFERNANQGPVSEYEVSNLLNENPGGTWPKLGLLLPVATAFVIMVIMPVLCGICLIWMCGIIIQGNMKGSSSTSKLQFACQLFCNIIFGIYILGSTSFLIFSPIISPVLFFTRVDIHSTRINFFEVFMPCVLIYGLFYYCVVHVGMGSYFLQFLSDKVDQQKQDAKEALMDACLVCTRIRVTTSAANEWELKEISLHSACELFTSQTTAKYKKANATKYKKANATPEEDPDPRKKLKGSNPEHDYVLLVSVLQAILQAISFALIPTICRAVAGENTAGENPAEKFIIATYVIVTFFVAIGGFFNCNEVVSKLGLCTFQYQAISALASSSDSFRYGLSFWVSLDSVSNIAAWLHMRRKLFTNANKLGRNGEFELSALILFTVVTTVAVSVVVLSHDMETDPYLFVAVGLYYCIWATIYIAQFMWATATANSALNDAVIAVLTRHRYHAAETIWLESRLRQQSNSNSVSKTILLRALGIRNEKNLETTAIKTEDTATHIACTAFMLESVMDLIKNGEEGIYFKIFGISVTRGMLFTVASSLASLLATSLVGFIWASVSGMRT